MQIPAKKAVSCTLGIGLFAFSYYAKESFEKRFNCSFEIKIDQNGFFSIDLVYSFYKIFDYY